MIGKFYCRLLIQLFPLFITLFNFSASGQDINDIGTEYVNRMKIEGKLTGKEHFTNRNATQNIGKVSPGTNSTNASALCDCWIPRDNTFQIAEMDGSGVSGGPGLPPLYRNDDWSTSLITLPFNICFYGTNVNQIYINNNGNISIGSPYSTYDPNGFPDSTYVMIAPFWADVDTRGALSGIVYYSITPTHLIVQWENVGYFGSHDDKLNTFQLIVTDGTDPIIPIGQNVSFCYKDMQWTTGDASNGQFGFGGLPATVGINKGSNNDYIQFGRFDQAGTNYDGPFGLNDEVDWLDNRSFTINACVNTTNIPPVLSSLDICDTIRLCENTTYQLLANYVSPEQNETTRINFSPFGMTGVSVVSNTPGNNASLVLEITGQTSNLGFHTIAVTAIDDGTPAAATNNSFVIEVMPAPLPSFTVAPSTFVQTNQPVSFINTTPPGSLLTWDFGDGSPTSTTINPQHTFTTGGNYTVTLSAMFPNGCITKVSQVISVCSASATFTVTNACENAPALITYTGTSSPVAIFAWDFNGGNILSGSGSGPYTVSWNTPGSYSVSLSVTESVCSTSATLPVTVSAIPVASISPILPLCPGDSPFVNFTGTAGSTATYTWNFGSANVLSGSGSGPYGLQWINPGNDQVSLIVSDNGCSDTSQISVLINPIPTATFSLLPSACVGDVLNISYTGSATSSANYVWSFNGGNVISGSGQGPYSVNWNSGGVYQVSLSVLENGCYSTPVNMPVTVTSIPIVSISPVTSLCEGQTSNVSFTGTAGASSVFNWNFGNATVISGTGSGPFTLQWSNPGIGQVQLSVTDNGCTAQSFVDVTVIQIPTSDFVINNSACINAPVSLNYIGSATATANYNWTFSGGTVVSGSGAGPYNVVWNSQGIYQVSLIVDENGCVSSPTDLLATINNLPVVFAGIDSTVCSGTQVQLGQAPLAGENYSWSPSTNLSNPAISNPVSTPVNNSIVTSENAYILLVTDGNGCMNYDTVLVGSHPVPIVNFAEPTSQCINDNNLSLTALSNIPTGVNFQWTFSSDASLLTSTQGNVALQYSATGTFPILLIGDYNGCPAQPFIDSITIHEMPTSDFLPLVTEGCQPLTVPFTNLSSGNGNSYTWDFGDGTNGNDPNAIHVFQNPGVYSISLVATNQYGCSTDTSYKNIIHVYGLPVGSFSANPPEADILYPVIEFQNNSTNVLSYLWDFGDLNTSTIWSPNHEYADTGEYLVTLVLVAPHGCVDTVRGLVKVEQHFFFYVPNSFTPNGDGVNDSFRGYGIGIRKYQMNIYDRWGLLIFSTDNYDQAWDGNIKSKPTVNDVYVYRIALTDLHDHQHVYVGDVTVVR